MRDDKNTGRGTRAVKCIIFASLLAAMGIVGLMWFLRPDISTLERRTLTSFPEFTWAGLWDGSFFSGVDTWYADTYPLREELISAQQSMENRYGLRSTQIVGGGMVADAIPDAAATPEADATATPEPTATPVPDGTVHEIGEFISGVYITNNCAYGLYYFSQGNADAYISTMNQIYENTGGAVNMYVMNVPVSGSVMLGEDVRQAIGSSDEGAAIEYIASGLDEGIHTLMVFDTLCRHNAEYIYFHADHHWTQLGAYYAYQVFCEEKGWTSHELSDFETMTFGENAYLGSYYASSNQSYQLAVNPDTVYAWVPNGTNDMEMYLSDGTYTEWRVILDTFEYDDASTYMVFAGGDRPYAHAHNDSITDGSAVLVIKDSFGNAFIPWLIDHYEDVYWIDFRYTDNTVSQMIEDYGVQDVIWECATATATGGLCNELFADIGQ